MKKVNFIKGLLLFLLVISLVFCYSYFLSPLYEDEIWNYGFAYNIANGLIPYKDFNLIVTPLYSYFVSIFIFLFGHHLWVLYLIHAILVTIIIFWGYIRFGKRIFVLFPLLLYCYPDYNFFCLFLAILMFFIIDSSISRKEIVILVLVSLIFLSKQTIGICMFIPMIYYSRNKIRSLVIFLVPIFILFFYLWLNSSLYVFLDYCFLGLFDFGESNSIYLFLIFEIPIVIYLFKRLIKTSFGDKKAFYVLMFQIVTIPICDDYHFMIGFILFLYYILDLFGMKRGNLKYYLIMTSFFLIFSNLNILSTFYLYDDKDSYLYGRRFDDEVQKSIEEIGIYLNNVRDEYDNVFIFSHAYLIKMNIGMEINKFDLINNGNMGYRGYGKYISEISDKCWIESCLFILDVYSVQNVNYNQNNYDIIEYVMSNYQVDDTEKRFIVYTN